MVSEVGFSNGTHQTSKRDGLLNSGRHLGSGEMATVADDDGTIY